MAIEKHDPRNVYGISDAAFNAVFEGKSGGSLVFLSFAASLCPEVLHDSEVKQQIERVRVGDIRVRTLSEIESSPIAEECHGAAARDVVRNAVVAAVMSHGKPERALRSIWLWDGKLATWCACAVAEKVLREMFDWETDPRIAIERARQWALGNGSLVEARKARGKVMEMIATLRAYTEEYQHIIAAEATASVLLDGDSNVDPEAVVQLVRRYELAGFNPKRRKKGQGKLASEKAVEIGLFDAIVHGIRTYPTADAIAPSSGLVSARGLAAGIAGVAIGAGIMNFARRT